MSPTSCPTTIIAAMKPAPASPAPSEEATAGMIGMIAPSPMPKSREGSRAGSAIDRNRKSSPACTLIAITLRLLSSTPVVGPLSATR
jgi:hypothetical protein